MNRFLGVIDYTKDISEENYINKSYNKLKENLNITEKLNILKTKHVQLSNSLLTKSIDGYKYNIMYIGNITNLKEIKTKLKLLGYSFSTKTKIKKEHIINDIEKYLESEIIITAYHEFREKFIELLKGNFILCIYDRYNNSIFISRDKIGTSSLYFTKINNLNIFSSNIEEILFVDNNIDIKNINELSTGYYAIYNNLGFTIFKYN
jgi:asparagine synthetase B (glutamine-hydrolysing)